MDDTRAVLQAGIARRRLLGMAGTLAATGFLAACDRDTPPRSTTAWPATAPPQPSAASPRIDVTPETPLIDQRFALRVSGLPPGQPVTIRAILNDTARQPAAAHAEFTTDADGVVDLSRQVPDSTGYVGVDGMALVWSASHAEATLLPPADRPPPGLSPNFRVVVERDGKQIASRAITRLLRTPDVQRVEVRDEGLAGTLMLPPGSGPHPAMLVLSGSGGGLSEGYAGLFASHGIAAFALAYFNYAHLPPTLQNVPLEYFETAMRWLTRRPDIRPAGVGVLGGSRGAELALLLGATFPVVTAVVGYAPSHVCWPVFGSETNAPAWTYHGDPVPAMPLQVDRPIGSLDDYLAALQDQAAAARAAIAVERINGPVLLLSGEDDQLWPSTLMAERVRERLAQHRHPYPVTHLHYPNAGHTIAPAYQAVSVALTRHPLSALPYLPGGTTQGAGLAAADSWPQVIEFLTDHLGV